jgi:Heterokaryon incompatibility protein (HET)
MASSYSYRPLKPPTKDGKPIRILKLFPATKKDAELKCELQEVEHLSNVRYEALSYVWGSPKGDIPIQLEGRTFLVTENCEAAMRRLRRRTRSRILWIDAICINQRSNEEKNLQVNLMSDIYSNATRVIVWFGDCEDGGKLSTLLVNWLWRNVVNRFERFTALTNPLRSWLSCK